MKHIRLYEEEDLQGLIGDLDKIGFEPYTGYMFMGNTGFGGIGFLVEAANEKECVALLSKHILDHVNRPTYSTSGPGILKEPINETMEELMVWLFEKGLVKDSGYYGPFKSKENKKHLNIFVNSYDYPVNPCFFIDLAKKHFIDGEAVIRDTDTYPEEFKYTE